MVFMSNYAIPWMLKRKYRSAIINVSSLAGEHAIPYISTYSATKAFNDFFSRSLEMQYSDQIDVLSLRPMLVESNLSKQQKSCTVASRNECARSAIKYLGIDYETNGYWVHRLLASITRSLPTPIIRASSTSESKKIM